MHLTLTDKEKLPAALTVFWNHPQTRSVHGERQLLVDPFDSAPHGRVEGTPRLLDRSVL